MAKNQWDYLIIGSGIEAVLKALELKRNGLKGLILTEDEIPGGIFRGLRQNEASQETLTFESHLSFWPHSERMDLIIERLRTELGDLGFTANEVGPLTFQNGQVQPFLGFGATENEAVDIYSLLTPAFQWTPSLSLPMIISSLLQKWAGEVRTLSAVTQLELSPQPQVVINGNESLLAQQIYYFDSPLKLSRLLLKSQSALPKSLVSKLSKTQMWTAVSLVYQHVNVLTESPAIHVLYGSKELPTVGRFILENGRPTSQWLCLVGPEIAADSELLGSTLREMKKQIKRMFPQFFEGLKMENILISPEAFGAVNSQLLEHDSFPKVVGLRLGGRGFSNGCGLEGDLTSLTLAAGPSVLDSSAQITPSV
jgi:hypothetical protein